MNRIAPLILCTITTGMDCAQKPAPVIVDVFRSPTCGCCLKWADHLRQSGFEVSVNDVDQNRLNKLKVEHGVPPPEQSCHTARVAGYTVEGHVPAADVYRLLSEKPGIAGIAVRGMPIGSPGMEVSDGRTRPYNVVSFSKDGATHVFTSHRQ